MTFLSTQFLNISEYLYCTINYYDIDISNVIRLVIPNIS